jgi:hypothetical protein
MKPISTRGHAIISYTVSATLLAAPELLRLKDVPAAAWAPRGAGASAGLYSLFTDFELAPVRAMPMPVHLALDAIGGTMLAASPWVLGFARQGPRYWLPHAVAGTGVAVVAALSRPDPPPRRRRTVARLLGRLKG